MDNSEFLELTKYKDLSDLQSIVRTCSNTSQKVFDALQCETAQAFLDAKTPSQIRLTNATDFLFEMIAYCLMSIMGVAVLGLVLATFYLIYVCVRDFFKGS